MTDKQIIIDYENLCENYSKEVGCYNTFDGSCIKEQCFTYRLLQLLKAKEQECEELKKQLQADKGLITSTGKMNYQLIQEYDELKTDKAEALEQLEFVRTLNTVQEAEIRKLSKTLTEIKEIAEEDFNHTCWKTYARQLKQILQKISECEAKNDNK